MAALGVSLSERPGALAPTSSEEVHLYVQTAPPVLLVFLLLTFSKVAIKTMKKTYESFSQCMELREVIFLKSLPNHPHLVPAYDIFLDPLSKKLHIAMEYMDGNLYQLMKARDHKPLDGSTVKSILFQILSGLEHIHEHNFFHRDIKPENILVSTSAPDSGNSFRRYSALVTPPSTPPAYSIKIADFGLARETHSRVPYTTYVSTRWYRAPEVLLRAGEYSAPVDIWAVGAMAVEIATLKPLFPGGNEVDQVWRVCEIMGSPGSWVKHGQKVGGGEWKDGIKLAQKLGFSFPRMAPHSLETHLPAPMWPASLAQFVTWCLMWDPKVRPTSRQALEHEFFTDAIDPLRPKSSSTNRMLGRKTSGIIQNASDNADASPALSTKTSSWFRKSLGSKDVLPPAVPEHMQANQQSPRPSPIHANTTDASALTSKTRPGVAKRATWANGVNANAAPIPILPSIRPVSPLPDSTTAQANARRTEQPMEERQGKKIGRQLSVNSSGNHHADIHRQEAERALNGNGLKSPTGSQKESFFSHLRKRARRLSGRHQGTVTPSADDIEANAGCAPWAANNTNRQSITEAQAIAPLASDPAADPSFAELDRALQSVRYSLDAAANASNGAPKHPPRLSSNPALKRHHSLPGTEGRQSPALSGNGSNLNRTRRSVRYPPTYQYETPDEEEELLDEAIASAHKAVRRLDNNPVVTYHQPSRAPIPQVTSDPGCSVPYLTPSPSKDHNGVSFGAHDYTPTKAIDIPPAPPRKNSIVNPQWPTPPYDENDWAAAAAASILATQAAFR